MRNMIQEFYGDELQEAAKKAAPKGRAEGCAEGMRILVRNLIKSRDYSPTQAMEMLPVPKEYRRTVLAALCA